MTRSFVHFPVYNDLDVFKDVILVARLIIAIGGFQGLIHLDNFSSVVRNIYFTDLSLKLIIARPRFSVI